MERGTLPFICKWSTTIVGPCHVTAPYAVEPLQPSSFLDSGEQFIVLYRLIPVGTCAPLTPPRLHPLASRFKFVILLVDPVGVVVQAEVLEWPQAAAPSHRVRRQLPEGRKPTFDVAFGVGQVQYDGITKVNPHRTPLLDALISLFLLFLSISGPFFATSRVGGGGRWGVGG